MSRQRVAPRLRNHLDFVVVRPQAGCAVCRQPWRRGEPPFPCEVCGVEAHGECLVALMDDREREALEDPADDLGAVIFVCHGCRS